MISKAATVDEYLGEVTEERRAVLERLRGLSRKVLAGYEEGMAYGMPVYRRDGELAFAFASQKQYIALYVKGQVVDEFRGALPGRSIGKGCIRFPKPESIDFHVVEQMLHRTRETTSAFCP